MGHPVIPNLTVGWSLGGAPGTSPVLDVACPLECHRLGRKDYVDLLWTTAAEFPGKVHNREPVYLMFHRL